MEGSPSVVFSHETDYSNLEHKVDEVDENVYNLSNQQVDHVESQMAREEKDSGQPSVELQTGFRILKDLMTDSNKNVNWPFMDPIEVSAPDLVTDYYQKIEKPVWLKLMKEKFISHEYTTITEFVSDFRLMLENCYRYNGPDHYVSKRGQKLETMLEQKLALLSRDLRAKTSIAATSGHQDHGSATTLGLRRRQKTVPRHDSTLLLNQLREEELQREREYRRQIILDRKAEKEALALEVLDWEEKVLFQGKYKDQMKCMWELPQIGLFLFLCQGSLNVGEIMQLELERCIMVPRESSTMHLIMTSLLSTPFQRQKIDKKTLMPYKVWNEKLRAKLQQWYKIYVDVGCDAEKACVKLGFEPEFFTVVGEKNPMERKRFHEIHFYRRVWIVKGLCDYCMQTQDCLRETVEIQPFHDQREYMLGTDGEGWRYLHFPQFCGADVRIYKQAPIKYPKIEIKPDPFDSKRKFPLTYKPPPAKKQKVIKKKKKIKTKRTPPVSPNPTRLRPAGLRQTLKTVIPLQLIDSSSSSSSVADSDEEATAESQEEVADNDAETNEDTNEATSDVNDEEGGDKEDSETDPAMSEDEKKSADGHSTGSDATIPYCDNSCSESVSSSRSCSRASSPGFTHDSVSQDTRFDFSRENSSSPMIDGHLQRKFRKGARLKDLPNSRAARNLNSFLFMEDSNSRSSDFGDNSNSGIAVFKRKLDLKDILLAEHENSSSSGAGDNSNSCDMKTLFKNSSINSEHFNGAITENNPDKHIEEMDASDCDRANFSTSEQLNDNALITELTTNQSDNIPFETKNIENDSETIADSQPIPTQDDENECENKRTNEACIGSHEQALFKNTNGLINRSESLMQDRNIAIGKMEEQYTDQNSNSESIAIVENSKNVLDTDRKSDISCVENLENSDNGSVKEGERNQLAEISDGQSNRTLAEATNSAVVLRNERTDNNEDSCKMAIDYAPEPQNDMTHDMNLHDPSTSQKQIAQNSEINSIIKQEPSEYNGAFHIKTESSTKSNSVKHEIDDESELKDNLDIIESRRVESSEVKFELAESVSDSFVKKEESDALPKIESMAMDGIKTELEDEMKIEAEVKEELEGAEVKEEKQEMADVKEEEEDEEEEEITPDMDSFKLIVESVEGLRELTRQFAEPEPIVIRRGKKEQISKPPPRKRCVVLLHNRLSYLLKELEPWESKLNQATKRARIKLRKEVEDYVEKDVEEPSAWDTDEETESGSEVSGDDNKAEDDKHSKLSISPTKLLKGRNSECSTPVKFEESCEDIDVSQRGRLRKRRIIPNNVEDQNPVKKSKTLTKSDSSQQPVLVQKPAESSGKITIGYSELIRQLKAVSPSGLQGTNSPILLQTSQGGKVLVTSIVPTGPKANQNVQNLMLVSQSSASVSQPVPVTMVTGASSTMKQSQHPTIQHLLAKPQSSETTPVKSSGLRHILPQTTTVVQGVPSNVIMRPVTPAGNQQTTPVKTPIILKPNTSITPQKLVLSYSLSSHKVPASVTNPVNVISQQVPVPTLSVVSTSPSVAISPQLVSLSTASLQVADSAGVSSKGKMKYYAANASTLPINVVQQLLATRGAKLQTGPNQQSILFIPVEGEGTSRPVISVSKAAAESVTTAESQTGKSVQQVSCTSNITETETKLLINPAGKSSVGAFVPDVNISQTIGSQIVNSSVKVVITTQTAGTVSLADSTALSSVSVLCNSSESVGNNSVSLSNVEHVTSVSSVINTSAPPTLPVTQMLQIQTDLAGSGSNLALKSTDMLSVSGSGVIKSLYSSPPKYPTNETVRTLLFKRKSSAEEKDKIPLPSPDALVEKASSDQKALHGKQFQKISPKPPNFPTITVANPVPLQQLPLKQVPLQQISPNQNIVLAKTTASPILAPALTVSNQTSLLNVQNAQQCVFTTISASKLNTLLLQTSAAGAKSIPSLIKLPSKAALDSAVKAVVTSVNITLPTVNIKVPSPTSLPSIGPRRNVTKTIQTMKSPIPVAPKVVTQSSGSVLGTTMSVANSNMLVTSSTLPLVSVAGHAGGMGSMTNLIPGQQLQASSLPVVTLTGPSGSPAINLLQAVRAQLGSTASASFADRTPVTSVPVISLAGQGSGQATNLVQPGQSLSGMVKNIDGKNVLTKMIPQTILTSQGLVQGFITPQGIVIPQAKKLQNGSQNASAVPQTGLQSAVKQEPEIIKQTSNIISNTSEFQTSTLQHPKTVHPSPTTMSLNRPNVIPAVQYIKTGSLKPSLANAIHTAPPRALSTHEAQSRASSAPLIMPVSQLKSPALPSANVSVSVAISSAPLKSPQQPARFIFPPSLSGVSLPTSTVSSASPMLNIPSGLLVPGSGGLQAASPLLNQLGFPLLQSGMAVQSPGVLPQNLNLLQTSLNPSALQQLVNPVVLTPGMISPQLLNQNQGLQLPRQNLQTVKHDQLPQNNLNKLSVPVSSPVQSLLPTSNATGQVQVLGNTVQLNPNISGINGDILKQINAAALVKQLASSQLQAKVNVVSSSVPDVKPILLQKQLNTQSNQSTGFKLATPIMQHLAVSKASPEVLGQVKIGGRTISGVSTNLAQPLNVTSSQQIRTIGQPLITAASKPATAIPKLQVTTVASLVTKSGSKTIAVNQITNEVVTPVCTFPTPGKQIQVPNRVIAVNTRSNKLEEVFSKELSPAVTPTTVSQVQSNPIVIKPLKSPETVQNTTTGSQQKIMLFSIGGQLVTQQGVPVTLENGVLKLMPQAIVQIANQTLTPKQIQQTLAKISQATLPSVSVSVQGNQSQAQQMSETVSMNVKVETTSSAASDTQSPSGSEALNRDHTYETPVRPEVGELRKSIENILPPAKKRAGLRVPLNEQLENQYVTVPNITSTAGARSGSNNVQFVLKPMDTSGFIVCPRMSGEASHSTESETKSENSIHEASRVSQSEIKMATASSESEARSLLRKSENKINVNGDKGSRKDVHNDEEDGDDLSEAPLVIDTNDKEDKEGADQMHRNQSTINNKESIQDSKFNLGSYMDKEAALNLLRLANQALGSSDEADDRDISNAGDATNKLGR